LTPECRDQYTSEGYLVIEDAVTDDQLTHLQKAFDEGAQAGKAEWLAGIAAGKAAPGFYDVPDPMSRDDIFIELADHPSYYEILMDLTEGQLNYLGISARLLPPSPVSYTGWHPDDLHSGPPMILKVQIYVDDVDSREGAFAFVPGSHRPESGPYPYVARLDSMPGHKIILGKAGTAIVFDAFGWHTAWSNRTTKPRKSLILTYEKRGEPKMSPFADIADKLGTPERRRLFLWEN